MRNVEIETDGENESIKSAQDLIAMHDERFVTQAFLTFLGREPGPAAASHFLKRVRVGDEKRQILLEISRLAEAKAFGCELDGLNPKKSRLSKAARAAGRIWLELTGIDTVRRAIRVAENENARQVHALQTQIKRVEEKISVINEHFSELEKPIAALGRDIAVRLCELEMRAGESLDRLVERRSVASTGSGRLKNFFVDISELVQRDAGSGIQRVTRCILRELLVNIPGGYRMEPIYATGDSAGYVYARQFTAKFLNRDFGTRDDEPIEYSPGDIFLGLDLQPEIVPLQVDALMDMRLSGVKVYFVIYDLLPIFHPEWFAPYAGDGHTKWLRSVAKYDGLVCISRSVADQLSNWILNEDLNRKIPLKLGYFHLGADFENSIAAAGEVGEKAVARGQLTKPISFLMVGTIEPRKGYAQALAAFELLWEMKRDVSLTIVGKKGWLVDDFVERLQTHKEFGNRLIWFEEASDELLDDIYRRSTCLLAASLDEGFGLPLIEAAKRGLPLLIRDIPVFREVAALNASYFRGQEPKDLADAALKWTDLKARGLVPLPNSMKVLTWRASMEELLAVVLQNQWAYNGETIGRRLYKLSSEKFGSLTGTRGPFGIKTNGAPGYLFYGPYASFSPGLYSIKLLGAAGAGGVGAAYIEAVISKGQEVLCRGPLTNVYADAPLASLEVTLDKSVTDFEIRLWVDENSDLMVRGVEFTIW